MPLSHILTLEEIGKGCVADTAARRSRFIVITSEVKSTEVSPPTVEAGWGIRVLALIGIGWVSLLDADRALSNLSPTFSILVLVALLREAAPHFNLVVPLIGIVRAKTLAKKNLLTTSLQCLIMPY